MRKAIFLLLLFCFANHLSGQISVSPGDTSKAYIHSLIRTLVGKGVEVHNIKYNGSPLAIGTFSDPTGAIGLTSGIILSTGNLKIAEGPNEATIALTTDLEQPGAGFLRAIAGATTFDAAVLEFDVVPLKNNFSIRFVFGSEEYNKLNFTLADIFAISVTGPGLPLTGKNIAVVPVVNDFISGENINNGSADFGVYPTGPCKNCSYFVYNQPGSTITGYNSYTIVFTASTPVFSCQTYHIAIGIADLLDYFGDSGIFIEPGSFGGQGIISDQSLSKNGIVEICSDIPYPVFSVTGTTAGVVYQWYINDTLTSSSGNTIITSKTAEYKVAGTMPGTLGGCTFSDSLSLSIGEIFTLKTTNFSRICTQDSIEITTIPDSPGNYNYKWSPQADFSNSTLPGQRIKPSADRKYEVEVKNKGGCLVKDTATVLLNPLIFSKIPLISDTIAACRDNLITLTSNFTTTSPPFAIGSDSFQIRWYNPSGKFIGNGNLLTDLSTVSGTYTDSLISNNGCILKDSFYLKTEKVLIHASQDTSICIGNTATITVSGAISYQWTSSDSLFNELTVSGFSLTPTASSSYFVTGTGPSPLFCKISDTVRITVNSLPVITKSADTTLCKGTGIKIHASGATITWDDAIIFPMDSIMVPMQNSVYKFEAVNNYHCSFSDSITITVLPLPQATITGKTNVCLGERTHITVSGGSFYNWQTKDNLQISTLSSPLIFPDKSAYYFVELALPTGCHTKDSVYIKVNTISLTGFIHAKKGTVCPEKEIKDTLYGPPGYFYQWQPGDIANAYIEVPDSGLYVLRIKDIHFCTALDSVLINKYCTKDPILPDTTTNTTDRKLFIPNVFTPNKDGINDTFVIRGVKTNASLVVYNRWGSVVYESDDYKDEWSADNLSEGIYYFIITTSDNGKTYKGWVEVLR